jgi:hypothetical protein
MEKTKVEMDVIFAFKRCVFLAILAALSFEVSISIKWQ